MTSAFKPIQANSSVGLVFGVGISFADSHYVVDVFKEIKLYLGTSMVCCSLFGCGGRDHRLVNLLEPASVNPWAI